MNCKLIICSAYLLLFLFHTTVKAGIIRFVPDGIHTTSILNSLAWDMESSDTSANLLAPFEPYEFILTGRGSIRFGTIFDNVVTTSSTSPIAANLSIDDFIDSSSPFSPDLMAFTVGSGDAFTTNTTGILGVRFGIDGQTHYGWTELSFRGTTHSLLGWAYEDQPNVGIRAGDLGNPVAAVPEPSSWMLMGLGSLFLILMRYRKKFLIHQESTI